VDQTFDCRDVDHAAPRAFSTRATCRDLDDTIHDIDEVDLCVR